MSTLSSLPAVPLFCAAMLGAMLFFAGVVAPMVFKALPADMAGRFLRQLFPRYYDVLAVVAILTALLAIGTWISIVLAAIAILFVGARFGLIPAINAARDASLEGDNAAKRRFGLLHGASVMINLCQMVALAVIVFLTI